MASAAANDSTQQQPAKKDRVWHPRIWEGCDFFAWFRLLVRNRFAVHWSCLYIAVIITFVSVFHTLLRILQEANMSVARFTPKTPLAADRGNVAITSRGA